MKKKIYCLIGERCKRVTFSSRENISDVEIVRDRLFEISNDDSLLQSMIHNKIIILQDIVRSQLSTWIRNHRVVLKKQTLTRDYEGKPAKKPIALESALIPIESDITNALKELEKNVVENNNTSHIKRLLKITMSVRRQWIEKESNRIAEIILKYPALKYYEITNASSPPGQELVTKETEGPRLVIYVEDKTIVAAFIVADGKKIKINNLSTTECLTVLLGTYHACASDFPGPYVSSLSIFDYFALNTPNNYSCKMFDDFKRDFRRWRLSIREKDQNTQPTHNEL
ncbi:hypothetical protein ALC62_08506 [Cyphomyrmex costatus]|uniref:Uncharacterized protein n=1 Tax=Cyphomyrmex costatus TaxID=456900 RepID=A0A151IH01_9HYME|nr:hypothetical protein ALC62_08506 [Cyphomyrmex costatus]